MLRYNQVKRDTQATQPNKEVAIMTMTIAKIAKILDLHSVPYKIICDRIIADSMIADKELFEETIDLTDYNKRELYDWLGY